MADTGSNEGRVRTVTLVVESKKTDLPGLDSAIAKLNNLKTSLNEINEAISKLSMAKIKALQQINITPTLSSEGVNAITSQIKTMMASNIVPAVSSAVTTAIVNGTQAGVNGAVGATTTKLKQLISTNASGVDKLNRIITESKKGYTTTVTSREAGLEAGDKTATSMVTTDYGKMAADKAKKDLEDKKRQQKEDDAIERDRLAAATRTQRLQMQLYQNDEAMKRKKAADDAKAAEDRKKIAEDERIADEKYRRFQSLKQQGYQLHSTATGVEQKTGRPTSTETLVRQSGGFRDVASGSFIFDSSTGKVVSANVQEIQKFKQAIEKTDDALKSANRNLITNLSHVTTWAASVGVLYGTLGLVRSSTESFIRVGMKTARLSQVFRGVGGSAEKLADDVMMLAAGYGRSADEAMEAAISWSRMGLTRQQVAEATRVSMMAANVAEMDAATATQHMQAIMITYKMQASELGGALGILNDISNKYAVTNNDLLTGISRTGAIAQQAGLSFAELSGIIGATVAATKQSGANIGNAVKSIITAFGNPAIQQFMRNMGVEVTAGAGDEIKDFSQTLQELYLAYQKMSEAERQFMLYRVAGKTQSQRMQAMLDNYIQSQVRAISAQLNLNSAELENQKITATLKAQLQGLSTEWNRFVMIQGGGIGGFGPGSAISNVTQTFHNLLAVMNAPVFRWFTTAFLGVLAALSAKMLIFAASSKEAGRQFAFVASTQNQMGRMRAGVSALSDAYMSRLNAGGAYGLSATGLVGRGLYKTYSFGSQIQESSSARYAERMYGGISAVNPKIAKALDVLNKYSLGLALGSNALLAYAKSANVAGQAMGGLIKASAMFGAIVKEWGIPLLVIWVLMKALGMATDALGLTMNRYKKQMEGVDAQIQAAQNASEAYLRTVKLLDTAQKEMAGGKAGADNIKKWTNAFRGMGDELGNNLADELEKATGENVNGILSNYKEKFLSKAFAEEQKLYDRRKEALQKAQKNLDDQRKKPMGSGSKLIEAEDAVKQKSTELLDSFMKVSKAVSDWAENNEAVQATLERNKLTLEAIRSIYEAMPTGGKADRNLMNIKLLERESEMEEQFRHQLDLTQKQAAAEMTATSGRREEIAREIASYRGMISELVSPEQAFMPVPDLVGDLSKLGVYKDKIRKLEEEYSQLYAPSALADTVAREKTIQSAERSRQIEANLRAKRAAQADFELADRYDLARTLAGYEGEVGAYGRNRTDVLRNQGRSIMEQMKANRALAMGGDDNAKIALQKNIYDLQSNILKLVERRYEIEKEEKQLIIDKRKEYEKALMLAGPGDMLKRLAAFRMAQSGTGLGGFMAMTPDIREMMGQVNPMRYSYEGMGLTRERREAGGITGDLTTKTLQDMILAIRRDAVNAINGLKMPKLPDSPAFINMQEAAQALAGVKTEAVLLQTSFSNLRSVVDALNAPPSTGWDVTNPGQIDAGPQSRGHYPGKVSDFSVHPKL